MCIEHQQVKDAERGERKFPTPHPKQNKHLNAHIEVTTQHTQKSRTPDAQP